MEGERSGKPGVASLWWARRKSGSEATWWRREAFWKMPEVGERRVSDLRRRERRRGWGGSRMR